ncbi:MAG: GNAT family N-acetyltransferase [bacterium]
MLLCAVVDQNRHPRQHDCSGYSAELSTPSQITLNEKDVCDLAEIYRETFTSYLTNLCSRAVQGMVENNVVAVVRDLDGKIVAVAMAEVAEISLDGSAPLRIAEISEVSTHPLHQRRGLSRLACKKVVDRLRALNIHALFSETRANHFAMMAVAYDSGLSPRGLLVQHCLIASRFSEVVQQTAFGDLIVFSL